MSAVSAVSIEPEAMLELAQSDPRRTLEIGRGVIARLPPGDHERRSIGLRALGIAARLGSDMSESLSFGRQSVAEAEQAGDESLRSLALMSLAGSMAFSGENESALQMLGEAAKKAAGHPLAEIEFQRGTVLGRMGEVSGALVFLSRALEVFQEHGDRESTWMTLHNRGMVHLAAGRPTEAEVDFFEAKAIDHLDGRLHWTAAEDHGLGVAAWLRGDIPQALWLFDQSTTTLSELLDSASEIQVSQCEVLLSAGLFREAFALAAEIAVDMQRAGLAEDEAEARLVGAQAALLAGKLDDAISWSDEAGQMFNGQNRATWAAMARLTGLQARYQQGAGEAELVDEAHRVAATLEEGGQSLPAVRAWFLAGSIALHLGMSDRARQDLSRVADRKSGPIEVRLQSRLAQSMLKVAAGDFVGADASARSGLTLLDDYQSALGATDIRIGVERHARDLGFLGLKLALESGRPRRVFAWMERTRSRALTHRPVAPPRDDEMSADLAALRQVSSELRTAERARSAALLKRQRRLQEAIRARARLATGEAGAATRVEPAALAAELNGATLIEFASVEGTLWAVSIANGRYRLREVGPESQIQAELDSLRFTMRRMARGRGSMSTAFEVARRLDGLLFGSLPPGDGPLVVVPTSELHVTPWSALPGCQGRPVTISPSAELWYRARRRPIRGRGALLAAGPDLVVSDVEVGEIALLYPGAQVLSSAGSEVAKVQAHIDGAAIAHIASHAVFQFENPMFSSLRLADGDLNVYDIERLDTAPDVVVLSACDSGFTDAHAGEELMGLSSALLNMGTRSIVASVGLVPDSMATKDLMVALHRGLKDGLSPSQALNRAQGQVGDTPEGYVAAGSFICIGAG